MVKIRNGLDLPILGEPATGGIDSHRPKQVGLIGDDYVGLKPTMNVAPGDKVKIGQSLFSDKKHPAIQFTSPVAGTVASVNRGAKRKFESLVIDVEGDEEISFPTENILGKAQPGEIKEALLQSGLWTAFRTRPFSKLADPESDPHSIFVTAMDSNPLAADPEPVISEHSEAFSLGLHAISHLTSGNIHVCYRDGSIVPGADVPKVTLTEFSGPHPSGLPGTHIHFLDPVSQSKTVWHLGYQDVIAIGKLFQSGKLFVERTISLAGPVIGKPRIIKTTLGSNIEHLCEGEFAKAYDRDDARLISGSVLSGRTAIAPKEFLGRYHTQVSGIADDKEKVFLGWQGPGFEKFSIKKVFASGYMAEEKRAFTTTTNGSRRAIVPIGMYEDVMPLDILPTFLLKALIVSDTEQAQELGCLELDEEDLALCTFVCPGKYEYGPILRANLNTIELEG